MAVCDCNALLRMTSRLASNDNVTQSLMIYDSRTRYLMLRTELQAEFISEEAELPFCGIDSARVYASG